VCLEVSMNEGTREWAVEEFGGAPIGDRRWRRRLVSMASELAQRPNGKVSEVYVGGAERQGAYGLLASKKVATAEIAEPMFVADARRCAKMPFVFSVIDGSSLTLADSDEAKGFGSIGSRSQGARGMKVISSLLVSAEGVTQGLGAQIWWARGAVAEKPHEKRETKDKETQHWLDAISQTRELFASQAPGTKCWFLIDREGDAWPVLMEANKGNSWFTVRGNRNRRIRLKDGSESYLRDALDRTAKASEYRLAVSGGPGRQAREAKMIVRACSAEVEFRDKRTGRRMLQLMNAVLAREEDTTPAGEKPIEWLLLTNREVGTVDQMHEVVFGYAQRWRIEEFHRTWKSGTCDAEAMQLRSVEAATKWATLLAAVAVRTEKLKLLSRQKPNRPAKEEFTAIELQAIALVRFGAAAHKHLGRGTEPTLQQVVHWVAEIGGYTGKSSGGPPGSITISRGLRDALVVARALAARDAKKPTCD
jgi:hypothetical protein